MLRKCVNEEKKNEKDRRRISDRRIGEVHPEEEDVLNEENPRGGYEKKARKPEGRKIRTERNEGRQ